MDYVRRHLRVHEAQIGATVGYGQVGLVLVGVRKYSDVARFGLRQRISLFSGPGLYGYRMAAQRLEPVESVRAVGFLVEAFSSSVVVGELDLALASLGIRERGVADVELAVLDPRDDRIEGGIDHGDLDPEDLAEGLAQIGVEPDDMPVLDKLVRRVTGVHRHPDAGCVFARYMDRA